MLVSDTNRINSFKQQIQSQVNYKTIENQELEGKLDQL